MARPVGATTRPQFYTYISEIERKEFVKWVKKNYTKDPQLAKWYGDQMYGKAPQTIALTGADGEPLFNNEQKEKGKQAIKGIMGGDTR